MFSHRRHVLALCEGSLISLCRHPDIGFTCPLATLSTNRGSHSPAPSCHRFLFLRVHGCVRHHPQGSLNKPRRHHGRSASSGVHRREPEPHHVPCRALGPPPPRSVVSLQGFARPLHGDWHHH